MPEGWPATLLGAAVAFMVPLLLAGIGECLVERAGVLNIGLEGLMLAGALAAVGVSAATGSPWAGLGAGAAAACGLGLLFAWIVLERRANQVVAGTALNLLSAGLTGALFYRLTQEVQAAGAGRLVGVKLPDWPIPGLADLPLLGPALFRGNLLVYTAFLLPPLAACFLWRTRPGLALRAAGEFPEAAAAAGVGVRRTRALVLLVGAALAGLAGVFLAIGHVVTFGEGMTAGKGFIALSLVVFGRWNPWGVLAGALLFSGAWGLATVLSSHGRGRPEEALLLALPYLVTLAALTVRSGHRAAPAALGRP